MMMHIKSTTKPVMKQMMANTRKLESTDRRLNASRFNKYLALETRQHCRWIKCGEICNGGRLVHQYVITNFSNEK